MKSFLLFAPLVVTVLFVIPTTILQAADAGWIMWTETVAFQPGGTASVSWQVVDGYDTAAECRKSAIAKAKNSDATTELKDATGRVVAQQMYRCLPGSFDPRR